MAREDGLANFSDEDYLERLLDSVVNQEEEDLLGDLENKLNNIADGETIDIFEDIDEELDDDIDSFDTLELERILNGMDSNSIKDEEISEAEEEIPEELPIEAVHMESVSDGIENDDMDELMQLLGGSLEEDEASKPESGNSLQSDENFNDEELSSLLNSLSYDENSEVIKEMSDDFENSDESRLESMLNDMSGKSNEEELIDIPVKEKKSSKKKGFFARIFKKDDKEDDNKISEKDENEQIISEMELGEFGELNSILEKSKTEKKEKKEKKEKPKKIKEKKPKKPKKAKEKKEKAPKEPDEIIPISVPVVLLMVTFVAGITLLLIFGGAAYDYNSRMDAAVNAFVKKDYNTAYEKLAGVDIKKSDEDFYMQVRIIMYPKRQYDAYMKYRAAGDYYRALNSLIKAVDKYDRYKYKADGLDLSDEYEQLYKRISKKLEYDFGISVDEARDISYIDNSDRYSDEVRRIVDASISTIEENIKKENKKSADKAASED